MILGTVFAAIIIPIVVCVILTIQVFSLKKQLREAEATCDTLMETMANGSFHLGEDELMEEETVTAEGVATSEVPITAEVPTEVEGTVTLEEQTEEDRCKVKHSMDKPEGTSTS